MTRQEFNKIVTDLPFKVNAINKGDYKGVIKIISEYQNLIVKHKDNVNTVVLEIIPDIKREFELNNWDKGIEDLRYAIQTTRNENTYKDSGNKFG